MSSYQQLRVLAVAFIIIFISTLNCFSQQAATATMRGRVVDAHGAAIAGAQVSVTQQGTSARRETTSNGDGFYVLSGLAPGDYLVKVSATGFASRTSQAPVSL